MISKILIIRFSSIGDIVLTTPIIRCVKTQLKNVEIHFVTKEQFLPVIQANPYLDKVITFRNEINEVYNELKQENYDLVIDLHKNLRSNRLKRKLSVKSISFNKINWQKWLTVRTKNKKHLPDKHIVDRYFESVKPLGVVNDIVGLDYFIPKEEEVSVSNLIPNKNINDYCVLVVGGSYYTKRIPISLLEKICSANKTTFIAIGSSDDAEIANALSKKCTNLVNLCGKLSINQSASLIKQAKTIVTSDTGMMHIASAFKKTIHSFWGNTIPEFGMYPYMPGEGSLIHENVNLSCRPCSKLGFNKCPKGHFKCMNDISVNEINL
ncbi:MAG: glycosyltransferase family 9 protein [Flavobacteriales bacterium]|nr:glycosyltransferase family 9 protein [Flavobacteriales bacterium]